MDIDGGAFDESLVALLGVLLGRVTEEARANCATNEVVVLARRQNVVLVPVPRESVRVANTARVGRTDP